MGRHGAHQCLYGDRACVKSVAPSRSPGLRFAAGLVTANTVKPGEWALVRQGDDQTPGESWGHKHYFKPGRESKGETHPRNLRVGCAQSPRQSPLVRSILKAFSRTD